MREVSQADVFSALLANQTMTGTNVLTGPWIDIQRLDTGLFQMAWTGTPVGTFSFEISDDNDPTAPNAIGPTVVTPPASFAAGNPNGSATNVGFDFNPLPAAKWIRPKYTNSSSAGTLTGKFSGKGAA